MFVQARGQVIHQVFRLFFSTMLTLYFWFNSFSYFSLLTYAYIHTYTHTRTHTLSLPFHHSIKMKRTSCTGQFRFDRTTRSLLPSCLIFHTYILLIQSYGACAYTRRCRASAGMFRLLYPVFHFYSSTFPKYLVPSNCHPLPLIIYIYPTSPAL